MALAAFFVAALGLLVASLSFGWQIAAWVMDGRRVRVQLLHGARGQHGVAIGKVGRDKQPKDLNTVIAEGFTGEEVIGIAVTNVGRAPVRVDKYSVHLARGGMTFTPIGDAIGPALPFRLPPGETETWFALADDGRRLVSATRSIGQIASSDVYMSVELGTGDVRRTRRSVVMV